MTDYTYYPVIDYISKYSPFNHICSNMSYMDLKPHQIKVEQNDIHIS